MQYKAGFGLADHHLANAAYARAAAQGKAKSRHDSHDPKTCNLIYDDEEWEFIRAMDDYKRRLHRPFPSWSEALYVLKSLGYRKA